MLVDACWPHMKMLVDFEKFEFCIKPQLCYHKPKAKII